MNSSSFTTFSLYSHTQHHHLKYPQHGPIASPVTPKSLFINPKLHPTVQLRPKKQISPKSIHHSRILPIPTSSLSLNTSISLHQKTLKFLSEKIVFLLLGSFIFLGSFSTRPAVALPAEESTCTEHKEEERDTGSGKSENEEMYLKILEEDPKNVEALKVVLFGKMRERKTKEAVEYVERLIGVEPDEVEWRLLQALFYEEMGNLSKAKRLFREILEESPLMLRALHGLAMVMHKNHEDAAVFEMLNKALQLAQREKRVSEERSVRILKAQMHVVQGHLEEGLRNFQVLVDENPRDFRPYLCQGIIYGLLDKKEEAEEQFELYRSLVPEGFPQREFLDAVALASKTKPRGQLEKEFQAEFSYRK